MNAGWLIVQQQDHGQQTKALDSEQEALKNAHEWAKRHLSQVFVYESRYRVDAVTATEVTHL